MATRIVVALFLLLIVGGAAVLFGRQFFYYLPFGYRPPTQGEAAAKPDDEEPIPTVQPAQVSVLCAGDVVAHGSVVDSGRKEGTEAYNFVHLFAPLRGEVESFDVRTLSQETALAGKNYGFGSFDRLNAPQDLGRAEIADGFNVIMRATDHTLDLGRDALHNELSWWHQEQSSIPVLGVAEPDPEANPGIPDYVSDVYLYEKDGFKVALLNHSWGIAEDDYSVVAALYEDKVSSDVSRARELGADVIVAFPHWGAENSTELSEEETNFARLYSDLGVDVVVGTNPRVLQQVEVLENGEGHKTLCFYSLGCLTSSLQGDNLLGGLAEFSLVRDDKGVCSVADATLKPVVTHRATGDAYSTYLLREYSDELAQSSWEPGQTREYYNERCAEILGDGYDRDACELRIEV